MGPFKDDPVDIDCKCPTYLRVAWVAYNHTPRPGQLAENSRRIRGSRLTDLSILPSSSSTAASYSVLGVNPCLTPRWDFLTLFLIWTNLIPFEWFMFVDTGTPNKSRISRCVFLLVSGKHAMI